MVSKFTRSWNCAGKTVTLCKIDSENFPEVVIVI